MKALFKKELLFYFNSPLGYISIVLFGVFANFMFVKDIFVYGSASLRPFFEIVPWLFMIFIPALTMRLIAEEKRTNTIEVLMSMPISEMQIVISKWLSTVLMVGVGLILTMGLPISMYLLTKQVGVRLYLPEVFVGYFGLILLASAYISISLFFSSITKNQIVAFLTSALVIFFLMIFSTDFAASILPKLLQNYLNYLSPTTQLDSLIKGVLDLRSIFYFVSVDALFIFLTVIGLENRQ
ncbi:ABC transporter [Candidatus Roizmanbacteria bacterium CG11_big_fil_rev_8_21_14_0_20_36_8]|uniref:ABC transporter n=2 Tax=Candidatus Roizmaniibacteriota TaxID=1752723 RepID=A0A2M6IV58_9BACT|nr:MAG: ABC transporter [Candidatus Roizmanbacteria bacterium CG11_big_fil_rev_8_21_14_0_20_36_8]PIZ65263.1 MAG: ABC transporter [Candidatus Roizmanbacteria bacterium CG_4_10_14_0_2_um_filter_36_9]